ncbi:MAG: hypothetical protein AB7O67_10895 [Vicinamibacterales bacterium]
MTSHFGLLLLFAGFVSTVFATIMRDEPGEQVRFALRLLLAFVATALVLGWVMYPFPA